MERVFCIICMGPKSIPQCPSLYEEGRAISSAQGGRQRAHGGRDWRGADKSGDTSCQELGWIAPTAAGGNSPLTP